MEVRPKFRCLGGGETEMDGGEIDKLMLRWGELVSGWRWNAHFGTRLGWGPGWNWDSNSGIWMEVGRDFDVDKTWLLEPRWRWDANLGVRTEENRTWIEVRRKSQKLLGVEIGPGWRWDAKFETSMGVRWDPHGAEIQFSGPTWR